MKSENPRFHETGEEGLEGEYLDKETTGNDPLQAVDAVVQEMNRYVTENPKKTAVIVAATAAAAVTVAVAAVAVTVTVMSINGLRKRWSGTSSP